MSGWNHHVCARCYAEREPGRDPIRLHDTPKMPCCLCKSLTKDGIWYRVNPSQCRAPENHKDEGDF